MPGPVLGARNIAVNKASGSALTELTYLLVGSNEQIRKIPVMNISRELIQNDTGIGKTLKLDQQEIHV